MWVGYYAGNTHLTATRPTSSGARPVEEQGLVRIYIRTHREHTGAIGGECRSSCAGVRPEGARQHQKHPLPICRRRPRVVLAIKSGGLLHLLPLYWRRPRRAQTPQPAQPCRGTSNGLPKSNFWVTLQSETRAPPSIRGSQAESSSYIIRWVIHTHWIITLQFRNE